MLRSFLMGIMGCVLIPSAIAASVPHSIHQLFEDNLLCKTGTGVDARDAKTLKFLKKNGVNVKLNDSELIDQEFTFKQPLQIQGFAVNKVTYQSGGSGSMFIALADGDISAFAQRVGALPIPDDKKELFNPYQTAQYYKVMHWQPNESFPSDFLTLGIKEPNSHQFYFGCKMLDW